MRRVLSPTAVLPRAIALASIAAILGVPAGASSRDPSPYRILAGPYSKKDAKNGGGHSAAHAALRGLAITVEFLEPEARAAFVKSIDPSLSDPFAARAGRPEIYSAFRVAFDNRSSAEDRKSTRLNSSHLVISYAVFCLKKKTNYMASAKFRSLS